MGWTIYSESKTESEALAEMRRLNQWESGDIAYQVLADGITGNGDQRGYYAAVRRTDKATGAQLVFASVCMITLRPFGYKDMSEDMGPNIDNCPVYVLRALEPLPAPAPQQCRTCNGGGQFNGRQCFSCDGAGESDRHTYARNWRKRAWARHGGEPQGVQMALAL